MPRLYVVATPIGNLQDMSPRAVETLRNVGFIAAEDTRVTMKLCQVFQIHTPLTSCHRHNENEKADGLVSKMLEENVDAAVVTDAGTPCVSDPGYALVRSAIESGIQVYPVPGCCAAVSALCVSGFETSEFSFYGFLPREKKDLADKLREISEKSKIAVLHESPYRVVELMQAVAEILPRCMVSASCDLTKLHELTIRGTPQEVLSMLLENPKAEKGEYCIVLDMHNVVPKEKCQQQEIPLTAQLVAAMEDGLTLRDAQNELVLQGKKKNAVKAAALKLKKMLQQNNTEEET